MQGQTTLVTRKDVARPDHTDHLHNERGPVSGRRGRLSMFEGGNTYVFMKGCGLPATHGTDLTVRIPLRVGMGGSPNPEAVAFVTTGIQASLTNSLGQGRGEITACNRMTIREGEEWPRLPATVSTKTAQKLERTSGSIVRRNYNSG